MLDRKQLVNYAKRNSQPSSAATLLAKKKAEAAKLKPSGRPVRPPIAKSPMKPYA